MTKCSSKREILALVVLFLFATFVRFYNYPQRIIFGPEQAISLLTSADYVNEKFSLLGQPDLIRNTSTGHTVFQNALFNYTLIPLQLLFRYNPFPITIFFTFLNLFTGIVVYLLVKKRHGINLALLTTFLFLFSSEMIHHSLFIWILNYLPILGILLYFCLTKKNTFSRLNIFLIGLLCGTSFALEYAFLFVAFGIFIYLVSQSPRKFSTIVVFMLGALIPNLTLVVFDLKHNFFHTQIFWQYALDIFSGKGSTNLSYYHFLSFWPLLCLLGAFLINKYFRQSVLIVLILFVYLFVNLSSDKSTIKYSHTDSSLPKYSETFLAAKTIANDKPNKFNVASLFDFDTRAHPLRYLLSYLYGQKPQPVENYSSLEALYVFAPNDYDIQSATVWEIKSFSPYTITVLDNQPRFILYKLTK